MKLLVVDDEPVIRLSLEELFTSIGDEVVSVNSGEEGLSILTNQRIDVAIVDYQLPGINGLELLGRIKTGFPGVEVIMITGYDSGELALEAVRMGAFDYISKPFNNDDLVNRISHIRKIRAGDKKRDYIFRSESMTKIVNTVNTAAATGASVLLTGESGTGKEVLASLIHDKSGRNGNLVCVNCGAIPEGLFESELFGSVRGAFTGAVSDRLGFIRKSDNGTLFLDEICEMPLNMQVKLLRVLQECAVTPVGSDRSYNINLRIVAATNKEIEKEVESGRFRSDLFYRLNVIRLNIPPLRERRDDIFALAELFISELTARYNKNITGISPILQKYLAEYSWPGNIRELRNSIERWVILSRNGGELEGETIVTGETPPLTNGLADKAVPGVNYDYSMYPADLAGARERVVAKFEKDFIIYHLLKNGWNVTKTASEIGIERQHLHLKMRKYHINKGHF